MLFLQRCIMYSILNQIDHDHLNQNYEHILVLKTYRCFFAQTYKSIVNALGLHRFALSIDMCACSSTDCVRLRWSTEKRYPQNCTCISSLNNCQSVTQGLKENMQKNIFYFFLPGANIMLRTTNERCMLNMAPAITDCWGYTLYWIQSSSSHVYCESHRCVHHLPIQEWILTKTHTHTHINIYTIQITHKDTYVT